MKQKTFLEENRTIVIMLNNDDKVIIETRNYKNGYEQVSVNFNYIKCDFDYVVDLYKSDIINL